MSTNSTIASSKKIEVSITLPAINLKSFSQKIKVRLSELFSNIYNPLRSAAAQASGGTTRRMPRLRMPDMKNFKFNKNWVKVILPVVAGVIIIAAIANVVSSLPNAQSRSDETPSSLETPDAVAKIDLNKKFAFPLRDEKGKEVGTFDYVIQSAELQEQIIVKGQRATAISDRVFLIINLKITNNLKQMIQLNTRDFIRLVVASNKNEQLALDIHNDPVEVQAISTKYTRVGIAISEDDAKQLIQLKVGEIDGDKQNIDLNFKY